MSLRTLFFTYANRRYEMFVLPYIFSALFHNEDAAVEICLESTEDFLHRNAEAMEILQDLFGSDRFLVRDSQFARGVVRPHSLRFLETPVLQLEHTYIGDIDILILDRGITGQHLQNMGRLNLPYSNILRKAPPARLTGLHFTYSKAYYPQADISDLDLEEVGDEELLCHLVTRRVGRMPPADAAFRPWHGFHVSERLNFFMADRRGRQCGLNDKRATEAYIEMRNSSGWRRINRHFDLTYRSWLSLMDSAIQQIYPEARVFQKLTLRNPGAERPPRSEFSLDIIPGPLRGYPFQSFYTGLSKCIEQNAIKSVLDLGCGDPFVTLLGAGGADLYVGYDICTNVIHGNSSRYLSPRHLFKCADVTTASLPQLDLALARDILNFLTDTEIAMVIENVKESGIHFLALTNYGDGGKRPTTIDGYRLIDWRSAFDFPEPDFVFNDLLGEFIPDFVGEPAVMSPPPPPWMLRRDRQIGVWNVQRLPEPNWRHLGGDQIAGDDGAITQHSNGHAHGASDADLSRSIKDSILLAGPYQPMSTLGWSTGTFGWSLSIPENIQSEADNNQAPRQSRLVLLEDGKPLGPAHSEHRVINERGEGRFSHWGNVLYLSTSDNSDPNTNGRCYAITLT